MKHQRFSEQKMEEDNHQHEGLDHKDKSFIGNINWDWKRRIFWVPIFAALIFITYGLIKAELSREQKYYCYKSYFKSTKLNTDQSNSEGDVLVNTRYDFKMYVDPKDKKVSAQIAKNGTIDPVKINLIGHIVQAGSSALIVGSHLGLEAISVGKVIGKQGKLYIFQHITDSNRLINKNIDYNQLHDITKIYKVASSDIKGKGSVQVLSQQNLTQQFQYDKIDNILPQVKLDFAYINSQKKTIRSLIGMMETIKRSKDLVLMVRWNIKEDDMISQEEFRNIMKFLGNRGYVAYTYQGSSGSYRQQCSIGSLIVKQNMQELFGVQEQILLFFPQDYSLPR